MDLPDDFVLRRCIYDAAQAEAWQELLSEQERARYQQFPVEKRRHEFLLGRVALRTLLADRLRTEPRHVPLRVTDAGALEVPGTSYHVSLAHSHERAVAVMAERPVGVDLERIAARDPQVADFLLHSSERSLLDTLPMEADRAFVLCWTLKEATLKALGTGMRRTPKKLRLDVDPDHHTAVVRAWNGTRWQVAYEEWDGFFLSVARPG